MLHFLDLYNMLSFGDILRIATSNMNTKNGTVGSHLPLIIILQAFGSMAACSEDQDQNPTNSNPTTPNTPNNPNPIPPDGEKPLF